MPLNSLDPFLEEEPDMLFQALRPQTGARGFIDYWRKQQGDIWQDYLGNYGQIALGGQIPNLTYQGFLRDFPFLQEYLKLSPWERGQRQPGRTFWNI